MKKILSILLAMAMVLSLCACGGSKSEPTESGGSENAQEQTAGTEEKQEAAEPAAEAAEPAAEAAEPATEPAAEVTELATESAEPAAEATETRAQGNLTDTYNPIIGDGDWIFPFSRVLRGILLPSLIYFLWRCGSVSISLQL